MIIFKPLDEKCSDLSRAIFSGRAQRALNFLAGAPWRALIFSNAFYMFCVNSVFFYGRALQFFRAARSGAPYKNRPAIGRIACSSHAYLFFFWCVSICSGAPALKHFQANTKKI